MQRADPDPRRGSMRWEYPHKGEPHLSRTGRKDAPVLMPPHLLERASPPPESDPNQIRAHSLPLPESPLFFFFCLGCPGACCRPVHDQLELPRRRRGRRRRRVRSSLLHLQPRPPRCSPRPAVAERGGQGGKGARGVRRGSGSARGRSLHSRVVLSFLYIASLHLTRSLFTLSLAALSQFSRHSY